MHARNGQPHPRYACHSRETSRELQRKLFLAAKRSRNRRFHALYDRIYRPDVLWRAWLEVKENGGSHGIDNQTFEDIESLGIEKFLLSIENDLKGGNYRPKPVLRVNIPKPDGKQRPLGIPTIRDRVVQQACKVVIEPLFEASFQNNSFGFRPKKSATQAVYEVRESLYRNWWVVDADIKSYFDTIDHQILISLLKRRISDRRVLKLIQLWLKSGVIEEGKYVPTTIGSPQGGVISPLLANIYLHVFDMHWNTFHGNLGKLVRYADDFVIICRDKSQVQAAFQITEKFMKRLKLTLHPEKTRVLKLDNDSFEFLGFKFFKSHSRQTGKLVPYLVPSQKAMKNLRGKIRELTNLRRHRLPVDWIVDDINKVVIGWRNYFRVGNSTEKFYQLDNHIFYRLFLFKKKTSKSNKLSWAKFKAWYATSAVERFYVPGSLGFKT